jgi:3D (Asp-Asp-Asp) domain-containing protein
VTAACEKRLLGRWVLIEGVGARLCEDTGSAITRGRVDIFVESHEKALTLGVLRTTLEVL